MGLWCVRDVLARFPSCGHETSCTNKTCSCLSDQEVFLVEGLRDFVFPDVKGFVVVKCLTADLPNQCHRCVVLYFGVVDF